MLKKFDPTKKLYVIGTGIVADEIIEYMTKENNTVECEQISANDLQKLPARSQCILGFSNSEYRNNLFKKIDLDSYQWPVYIHPSAEVSATATIGRGTVIHQHAIIGYRATLGEFCWITTGSQLAHGVQTGNHVTVNPGTVISGSTQIGNYVKFGQCCSVKDQLKIGNNIEFYMNSVVTKDILDPGTYYGNKKVSII